MKQPYIQIPAMRVNLKTTTLLASAVIVINSCSKKDNTPLPDPCLGYNKTITFTKTESVGTSNNGTITILEPRGDTISYKLNSGAYQASWYFTNVPPGNHVVTIKNDKGCTDTIQITILNYGPKYALVKQIIGGPYVIGGYCGPCHLNGSVSGGKNFDTDASIIASWDRIKARAVDNVPTQMPELPNVMLTAPDKQKITDWVNAGHRQSD